MPEVLLNKDRDMIVVYDGVVLEDALPSFNVIQYDSRLSYLVLQSSVPFPSLVLHFSFVFLEIRRAQV